MELEDYIYKAKNPPKREPEIVFSALELDHYTEISSEKKKLIKAAFNHLSKDDCLDVLERRDRKKGGWAYYQSVAEDGTRGLIRIETCRVYGSYDTTEPIPDEKFFPDYNKRHMIGEQKYKEVSDVVYYDREDPEFSKSMYLYYTLDGGVFIPQSSVEFINKMSVDELGNHLANIIIHDETMAERRRAWEEKQKNEIMSRY